MVSPMGTAQRAPWMRTLSIVAVVTIALLMLLPTGTRASVSGPASTIHGAAPASASLPAFHGTGSTFHTDLPSGSSSFHPAVRDARSTSLSGAIRSLSNGAGPAHGAAEQCQATGADAAHCALTQAPSTHALAPHPDVTYWGWQNATWGSEYFLGGPAAGWGASMAWDNWDGYLVYYGGCNWVCPDNETWAYYFGSWYNITNSVTPPAVYYASMTFDYAANVTVLFGGCGVFTCPMNETWVFTGGNWYNASAPFCFGSSCLFAPSPRFASTMVFANDTADHVTILFGGCGDIFCYGTLNDTWEWVSSVPGGAWVNMNIAHAPSPRGFAAAAYLTYGGGILLFGGCIGNTALYSGCTLNDTWDFYGGTWYDETSYLASVGSAIPPARGAASMSYDEYWGEIVMTGGYGGLVQYNDTWGFYCTYLYSTYSLVCAWYDFSNPLDLPSPVWSAAMAAESGTYPPVLAGGTCYCGGAFAKSSSVWVWELQRQVVPAVTPNPAPVRTAVQFNATFSGGTAPYTSYWSTGNGNFVYPNAPFNYTVPGVYETILTSWDAWGATLNTFVNVTITGVTSTAQATPSTTEVGLTVAYSATAGTGGTEPYNYTWTFGDGAGAFGASASHAFTALGTYEANLTVTDAHGAMTNSSVNVTIVSGPSVSFTSSAATTDAGLSVTFTPTPSGGVAPYSYNWSFGDGGHASSASPSHSYASAGTYAVNVTLTDNVGGTATHSLTVTVNPALSAAATVSAASVTNGTAVWFNVTASGGTPGYTYTWSISDGHSGSGTSVSHTFATKGNYTATVTVTDTVGGSVSKTVSVEVTPSSHGGGGGAGGSGGSSSLPGWIWYVVIAIVVLAIVVGAAMMMMRRKKPGAGTSAPPSGASGAAPPGGAAWSEGPPAPPPGSQ